MMENKEEKERSRGRPDSESPRSDTERSLRVWGYGVPPTSSLVLSPY